MKKTPSTTRKTPSSRRPGNQTRGYDSKEFNHLKNRHILSYPKRIEKFEDEFDGEKYFPVTIMFLLEGFEAPEFLTLVKDVTGQTTTSNIDSFAIKKQDMTHDSGSKKWIIEMTAKHSRNPTDEHLVQFDAYITTDWGSDEILGILVTPTGSKENNEDNSEEASSDKKPPKLVKEQKKLRDDEIDKRLLTVECDIIIPPPPPTR